MNDDTGRRRRRSYRKEYGYNNRALTEMTDEELGEYIESERMKFRREWNFYITQYDRSETLSRKPSNIA